MRKKPKYRHVNWKRNIRRIPDRIEKKILSTQVDVQAAVVIKIPISAIAENQYEHIGLKVEGGVPMCCESILPDFRQGVYSKRNHFGYEIIYENRPKVTRSYTFQAPNWGDWSNGSHLVHRSRPVYQREFISPKLLRITSEILGEDVSGVNPKIIVKFAVDEILTPSAADFNERLFFNLNLLQENIGVCDVFPADASREEYLQTLFVDWEILPPGNRECQIERIVGSNSNLSPRERTAFEERHDYLMSFNPSRIIVGTSGFYRYFGAMFSENFIIFENVKYGNAIYVMFDDWESISSRSRTELLSMPSDRFIRIVHRKGWKRELRNIINERLSWSLVSAN